MTARPYHDMDAPIPREAVSSLAPELAQRFAHPANPMWDLAVRRKNGILRPYPQLAKPLQRWQGRNLGCTHASRSVVAGMEVVLTHKPH